MSGKGRRHVAKRSGVPQEELSDIPPFLGASPNVPQDGHSFTLAAANVLSNASKAVDELLHDLYARWSRYMDEHGSDLSNSDPYDLESSGVPQSQNLYAMCPRVPCNPYTRLALSRRVPCNPKTCLLSVVR